MAKNSSESQKTVLRKLYDLGSRSCANSTIWAAVWRLRRSGPSSVCSAGCTDNSRTSVFSQTQRGGDCLSGSLRLFA